MSSSRTTQEHSHGQPTHVTIPKPPLPPVPREPNTVKFTVQPGGSPQWFDNEPTAQIDAMLSELSGEAVPRWNAVQAEPTLSRLDKAIERASVDVEDRARFALAAAKSPT